MALKGGQTRCRIDLQLDYYKFHTMKRIAINYVWMRWNSTVEWPFLGDLFLQKKARAHFADWKGAAKFKRVKYAPDKSQNKSQVAASIVNLIDHIMLSTNVFHNEIAMSSKSKVVCTLTSNIKSTRAMPRCWHHLGCIQTEYHPVDGKRSDFEVHL